ncbi:hypothetical protein TEA_013492 [Camellia sinensis var. sinensis]|uniref:Protein kinase domain-containing protein n=1 Tax=Camellia sinensis var. sinensis TaxID=542762 RepID=A0A4S4EHP8_CAMSN|nr:hypothetical protein TEA_013492 [Camellia sinensis var. sinensis]
MPVELEGYIRPGCTILTLFISMPNFMWSKLHEDPVIYIHDFVDAPGKMLYGRRSLLEQAPKLCYVYPTCFEAGKPMEFMACGINLLQPQFWFLVSFAGKCLAYDYCVPPLYGDTEGVTASFNHQLLRIYIPHTEPDFFFGPAFIEVENESGLSNFVPILIGNKEICSEIKIMEASLCLKGSKFMTTRRTEVISLLIEKGADVNSTDRWGRTPLSDAHGIEHEEICKILKAHGGIDPMGLDSLTPCYEIDFTEVNMKDGTLIGEGAYGEVYLVKWRGTEVAAKTIRSSIASNEMVKKTFLKELALWQKLRHPNIVQFLGVLRHSNRLIFLTEYLCNGSLYDILRKRGRLDPPTAVAYALDIARGMNYLHQHKPHAIIHRDLTPRNVLQDEAGHLKVTDFGLSKIVQEKDFGYKMTGGTGSYRYMAPEVYRRESYGKSVDVFSFALIVHELHEDPVMYIPDLVGAPGKMLYGRGSLLVYLNNVIFRVMRDGTSVMQVKVEEQAPKLCYVYPTCFEAGKPMEFMACGINLLQPKFWFLVSFAGKCLAYDYCVPPLYGDTEGVTASFNHHRESKSRFKAKMNKETEKWCKPEPDKPRLEAVARPQV